MNNQVICENPTLILNRKLLSFIKQGGVVYTTDNLNTSYTWKNSIFISDTKSFNQQLQYRLSKAFYQVKYAIKNKIKNIDDAYFLNPVTGETCSMFVYVPCGHCLVCKQRKRNAFAVRCEAESQCHSSLPYFITLTYDNEHLPFDNHLNYSDVQRFFKRLRTRLSREYSVPEQHIRYACCGEYGPKTHRPHYHLIIWGLPYIPDFGIKQLFELVDKTWSVYDPHTQSFCKIGRTQIRQCFNSRGAGKYVGKYISKQSGNDDCFLHCSSRNGGIGSPWIKDKKQYLLDNDDCLELKYTDRFTGATKNMPLIKYFIDKTFPSVSRRIPQEFREAFGNFLLGVNSLEDDTLKQRYIDYFTNFKIQLPDSLLITASNHQQLSHEECISLIENAFLTFHKYREGDWSDADILADRRNLYFTQVSLNADDVDIIALTDKYKKQLAKEKDIYTKC